MPDLIKTKGIKTGSYTNSTTPQLQEKSSSKSQQDVNEMAANYANVGAAIRNVMPVGNQSYQDFQRTRKSFDGQKAKADYETSNKLPKLTDADYQGRIYKQGLETLNKTASNNPGVSVFNDSAKTAAYGATNKTSMEMGNQVSGSNGSIVDRASLADRSKRIGVSSAYTAPGMSMQSQYKNGTMEINVKPKPKSTPTAQADAKNEKEKPSKMAYEDKPSMKQLETTSVKNKYAMGTKGIKTKKMTAKQFEDSPEDKRVDAKAMKSMNKTGAYAEGTKSIKMKPKMSMDSDATATAPVRLPAGKPAFTNYSKQLSTLSDNDVYKEVADNRLNMTNNSAKWNEAQDTINTRNTKKALIAAESGYKMGSKGIKTKKMY